MSKEVIYGMMAELDSHQNIFESNRGMDLLYSATERSGLVKAKNDLKLFYNESTESRGD
jgi:hypothetical protein